MRRFSTHKVSVQRMEDGRWESLGELSNEGLSAQFLDMGGAFQDVVRLHIHMSKDDPEAVCNLLISGQDEEEERMVRLLPKRKDAVLCLKMDYSTATETTGAALQSFSFHFESADECQEFITEWQRHVEPGSTSSSMEGTTEVAP